MLLLLKLVSTRPDAPGVVKFFHVTSGEGNGDGEALLTSGDAVLTLGDTAGDGECDITQGEFPGDKPTTPDI